MWHAKKPWHFKQNHYGYNVHKHIPQVGTTLKDRCRTASDGPSWHISLQLEAQHFLE